MAGLRKGIVNGRRLANGGRKGLGKRKEKEHLFPEKKGTLITEKVSTNK